MFYIVENQDYNTAVKNKNKTQMFFFLNQLALEYLSVKEISEKTTEKTEKKTDSKKKTRINFIFVQ